MTKRLEVFLLVVLTGVLVITGIFGIQNDEKGIAVVFYAFLSLTGLAAFNVALFVRDLIRKHLLLSFSILIAFTIAIELTKDLKL